MARFYVLCVLVLATLYVSSCSPVVTKRRVVAGDLHLSAGELLSECCRRSLACCGPIELLLSNRSWEYDCCYTKKIEFISDYENETGKICPFRKKHKQLALKTYCQLLNMVDKIFVCDIIKDVTFFSKCVNHNSDQKTVRKPETIVEGIKLWRKNMVARHNKDKCCFEPSSEEVCSERRRRTIDYSTEECEEEWSKNMIKSAAYMSLVYQLEQLGKSTTCLRGCVDKDMVECSYHLLPGNL